MTTLSKQSLLLRMYLYNKLIVNVDLKREDKRIREKSINLDQKTRYKTQTSKKQYRGRRYIR